MNNDAITYLGLRNGWDREYPFGLSAADHRYHLYIIGKTGSGKTTLLRNLIIQHIEAGHGVGLIDPHGDLAEDLLSHIPPCRADDLVYFHPGDLDFPIGLNLLANVPPDDRHLVASGIVGAFKSIYGGIVGVHASNISSTTPLLLCWIAPTLPSLVSIDCSPMPIIDAGSCVKSAILL